MSVPGDTQELRTQLAAILRANRDLGAGYEQIAIDQILDATGRRGGAPRRPPPPPRNAPERPDQAAGPWPFGHLIAAFFMAVLVVFVVLSALGVATAAVFGLWPLIVLLLVFRGARRWGRRAPRGFASPYRSRWQRHWY